MTGLFIAGLTMGAVGSVHCIGMCGPLALSLPVISTDPSARFISSLLYNCGRIIMYALLGAIFGLIGMSFALFGFQQWLSIILGILILLFIILPKKGPAFKKNTAVLTYVEKIRTALGQLFSRKNYRSVFFIGLVNGLLPCGLVYMAVAAAVSTASVTKSSLFMASFGMGTLPVMWSVSFFAATINIDIRRKIRKLYPYVMGVVATLLILRGLGLNIPYMSPGLEKDKTRKEMILKCHDQTQ